MASQAVPHWQTGFPMLCWQYWCWPPALSYSIPENIHLLQGPGSSFGRPWPHSRCPDICPPPRHTLHTVGDGDESAKEPQCPPWRWTRSGSRSISRMAARAAAAFAGDMPTEKTKPGAEYFRYSTSDRRPAMYPPTLANALLSVGPGTPLRRPPRAWDNSRATTQRRGDLIERQCWP